MPLQVAELSIANRLLAALHTEFLGTLAPTLGSCLRRRLYPSLPAVVRLLSLRLGKVQGLLQQKLRP
jgi:hypothetical protein